MLYNSIESAGFYVPGGKALYPSSVLMNAIPALVAGVERRVMVSPISDLKKSSIVLAAGYIAGVTEVFCMGGAHSVAALAYGTKTIEPVNKIVGPGNAYVAEAKRQVFGIVGIDSIAGPSEVLIVSDDTSSPEHIAIDLLSQAEHDEQAQAILITDSLEFSIKVELAIEKFLKDFDQSLEVIILENSARTAQDAAKALDCNVGAIVKSLLFRAGDDFILCLVAGDKRCSLNKLKKFKDKKDISMASPEEVKTQTGYTIGGVSPIGHLNKIEIIIDKSLERFNQLFAAAGHPNCVFKINFINIQKITNGKVEDIIE